MSRSRLFSSFILRALAREKLRSVLAIGGIALGLAVMVAVRLANVSVIDSFRAAVDSVSGDADLRISGTAGAFDELLVRDVFWLEPYGQVSPVLENYAMVVDEQRRQTASDRGPLLRGELLYVLGVDVLRDSGLRQYDVLQLADTDAEQRPHKLLDLLLARDAIILTETFASRAGLELGATIRLAFGSQERELVVRGLLRDSGPARTLQGNFAVMDLAAAQWASNRLGELDGLDVELHAGVDLEEARRAIAAKMSSGLQVEPPANRTGRTETMVSAFQFNLAALSAVALVVGLFLIYNTVSVSVAARREEIGIMMAVGGTRRAVLGLFLGEALLLTLAGIALGLPLGQFLARFAVQATAQTVETFYIAAVAETTSQAVRLAVSDVAVFSFLTLGLALLAAAVPAWSATRVDPVAVVRGSDQVVRRRGAWRAPAAATAWLVLALGCTQLPPVSGLPVFGFLAELGLLAAVACGTPVLLTATCHLIRFGSRLAGRITWRLGAANLQAATGQTAISVAALSASLAMMVAIGVMVGSFRETVVYWLDSVLTSDLVVKPVMNSSSLSTSTLSAELAEELRAQPEVATATWYSSRQIPYRDSMIRLDTSDLDPLLRNGRVLFKEPAAARDKILSGLAARDSFALVSESFSLRYQTKPGELVRLETPRGPIELPVLAVYYDYSSNLGTVLLDYTLYQDLYQDDRAWRTPLALSIMLQPGIDAEATRRQWITQFGAGRSLYIVTNEGVRREAMRIFESTFTITYALQLIAILIAGAGVLSTLLRLIQERRREIGLLSLIGMSTSQVRRMVMLEAVAIGAISQLLGVVGGIGLSLVLIRVINVQSFGWTIQFHLPLYFLLQSTVAVLAATIVVGWIPAYRAAGIDALATVREL